MQSYDTLPPYYKQPIVNCDLCGAVLLDSPRFRIKVVYKGKYVGPVTLKTLHVCENCLAMLKSSMELKRKHIKIKYKSMPILSTAVYMDLVSLGWRRWFRHGYLPVNY